MNETMKIEKDKWVAIHYTLKNDEGTVLDSSVETQPLGYVHGRGYLIPGMENALEGRVQGDKFSCKIEPKDGYGEYDPALVIDVPVEQFEMGDMKIEVGMQFQVMTPEGPRIVRAAEVSEKTVKIDGNHELAGKNLNFDIEIVEVREATEDELNPVGCGGGCGGCGGGCGNCDSECNCGDGECNCENGEGGCCGGN